MKRPILLAALLATSSVMVQPAHSQETASGTMLRMFDISTPSAGKVNFIGTGTANFNQAIGTNNNFNVGSSTALGVNASASSTADYQSEGAADLQLAGTSRLQQTIGTATSAFNTQTAAESSALAAHTAATETANSQYTYGSEWTEGYTNGLVEREGWVFRAAGTQDDDGNLLATEGEGWYSTKGTGAGEYVQATEATKAADFEAFSRSDWKAGWDATYAATYTTAYDSAVTSSQTSSSSGQTMDRSGIISGEFSTTDYGSATTEVTAEDTAKIQDAATTAAKSHIAYDSDAAVGEQYSIVAGGNYENQTMTQEEMKTAYDAEYTKAFNTNFSSAAGLMRSSDSTVTVTGLGVIADVNASDNSSFKASSKLLATAVRDGNGNGNASSGANLSTSSYANQSNSSTASAFMQAFSGGLPNVEGTTTIDKVNPIYEIADDPTSAVTGYTVTTSTVQTTQNTPVAYDVDENGNLTAQ